MIKVAIKMREVMNVKMKAAALKRRLHLANGESLKESILRARIQAQREVPKDTGDLLASFSHSVEYFQGTWQGSLSASEEYGIYVHEDLTKFHEIPTKAKFFSDPLARESTKLEKTVKRNIKKAMKEA